MNAVETITRRNVTVNLIQDADGFWGFTIGTHTVLPIFYYRSTCIDMAIKHIEGMKRQPEQNNA